MSKRTRITSIEFKNYKAFEHYSISLSEFNVLVGPDHAGKSTVLDAIRILAEGLRRHDHAILNLLAVPLTKFAATLLTLEDSRYRPSDPISSAQRSTSNVELRT
jgi:predicted ATP-dependent endonuclease of OLD family